MRGIALLTTVYVVALVLALTEATRGQNTQPRQQDPNAQGTQNQPGSPNGPAVPGGQTGDPNRRHSLRPNLDEPGTRAPGSRRSADAELAGCLIVDNEGEVAMGQMALQRAKNDDVKQFAKEMVEAHTQMIEKLQKFSGQGGAVNELRNATGAAQTDQANAINNRTAAAATEARTAAGIPSQQQDQPLDHVALKRELGALCKQTLEREFSQKSADEFDHCYMGQQIGAHLHAIDAMKVAQNHGSEELRQALDEGIRTAEKHLQHAKELEKRLDSK
jgi:predicted outer membrane protein